MPKHEETIMGTPCWVDLTSTDLEKTKPFYAALFGWNFDDTGPDFGHYNIISVGEDVVGGSMQYNADFMGPEPINTWSMYFATPDAIESVARAEGLGGATTTPPMQVGDQGTMAEATDPSGVAFGLWQPDQRKGFDKWGEHGFPGWFELHTREFDAASTFYSSLLGAELGSDEMSEDMRYHTLNVNGNPSAGIWDITGALPDEAPVGWNLYFIVDDTDVALATVRENGGTVLMEPEDTPHGRMSTVQDPAGAVFNIISGGMEM